MKMAFEYFKTKVKKHAKMNHMHLYSLKGFSSYFKDDFDLSSSERERKLINGAYDYSLQKHILLLCFYRNNALWKDMT